MLIRVASLVGSALATDAIIGVGVHVLSRARDWDADVPRMRQRSVEIRRSKCKSYVVLRGAILEQ